MPMAAVAVKGHVGTATIVMIERYGLNPRPNTKARIAAALDVPVEVIWPVCAEIAPV